VPGLFDRSVVAALAANSPDAPPVLMPLSNPTANAECTAAQAYEWTDGRVVFASGSPFDPVVLQDGSTRHPSQANNMFLFPGIGLGATLAKARLVSDSMLFEAALACADSLTPDEIQQGRVFPAVARIRHVSKNVAVAVIKAAVAEGLNRVPFPDDLDLDAYVASKMYYPFYVPLYQSPYDTP